MRWAALTWSSFHQLNFALEYGAFVRPADAGRECHLLAKRTVTLRTVAERVGLTSCTVSSILNDTPASRSIPQRTKDRVMEAVAELNYRPNLSARSLRTKRSYMVAVTGMDLGRADVARVISGIERHLRRRGYVIILGTFAGRSDWTTLAAEFQQRGVDGIIAVGTPLPRQPERPVVRVDMEERDAWQPLTEKVSAELSAIGESAARAVLLEVENRRFTRSKKTARVPQPLLANVSSCAIAAEQPLAMGD